MCCGNKRSQLDVSPTQRPLRNPQLSLNQGRAVRTRTSPPLAMPTVAPQATVDPQASVQVYYLEAPPIRVQGLSTGRSYEFSSSQPVQNVDARDASSLLNTRYFRRA
jgi:hypothetical protein